MLRDEVLLEALDQECSEDGRQIIWLDVEGRETDALSVVASLENGAFVYAIYFDLHPGHVFIIVSTLEFWDGESDNDEEFDLDGRAVEHALSNLKSWMDSNNLVEAQITAIDRVR